MSDVVFQRGGYSIFKVLPLTATDFLKLKLHSSCQKHHFFFFTYLVSYFPIVFPLVLSLCSMLFNIKSENIQTLMVHQNLICYQPCRAKQTTSFNRFLLYFISFYSYHQGTKGQIPSGKSHFKNPRSPREVCPTFLNSTCKVTTLKCRENLLSCSFCICIC